VTKFESLQIVRVYQDIDRHKTDFRMLVDRLWPRGISKNSLKLDYWAKELAPSTELRKWYDHQVDRFDLFRDRYLAELANADLSVTIGILTKQTACDRLLLLTATKDIEHSSATVLGEFLVAKLL
jgi:uncharacterized protein YeaO (DUF488 family)